jgi:hypothetical protein
LQPEETLATPGVLTSACSSDWLVIRRPRRGGTNHNPGGWIRLRYALPCYKILGALWRRHFAFRPGLFPAVVSSAVLRAPDMIVRATFLRRFHNTVLLADCFASISIGEIYREFELHHKKAIHPMFPGLKSGMCKAHLQSRR